MRAVRLTPGMRPGCGEARRSALRRDASGGSRPIADPSAPVHAQVEFRGRAMGAELGETPPPPPNGLRPKFWRGASGIVAGVASGAVLGIGIVAGPAAACRDATRAINFLYHFAISAPLTASVSDTIDAAAWQAALIYSMAVGIVAVPIWMCLGRLRRNTSVDGLLLGAVLGGALGYFVGGPLAALKFGAVGACAGLITWAVAHGRLAGRSARHP